MTQDEMRERFHALGKQQAKIEAQITPLREQRDALVAEYEPQIKALEKEFMKLEADSGLFEIKQEIAAMSRALNGKTGAPPAE